jgi:hypothetical protein
MIIGKNVKGKGRDLILRYYPGIHLEGLRKSTETSVTKAGLRASYLNPEPPEC